MNMEELTRWLHITSLTAYGTAFALCFAAGVSKKRMLGPAGIAAAASGLAAQIVLLVARWASSGHLPVTGLFESLHFLALWVVVLVFYFHLRYGAWSFLPAALALVIVSLAGASLGPKGISPLVPALDTPLFFIHVATSFAAYGFFGVAALIGLYRLTARGTLFAGAGRMMDESLYLGYILFTWTMLAGSLWAYLAWGSYWTWTTKGMWSYLLWFYYSGVIHVRGRRGWQGWPLGLLSIGGFLLVLFTYLGLGLLFQTSHPLI